MYFFFFNDTATTEIYTLSLHDALPICREYGSAMSYTEFVSADGILHGNDRTRQMLEFDPSERPMTFQIFGSDEDKIEEAARRIEQLGPSIIDRSEEHTSELQSRQYLVCRLLLEK